MSNTASKEESIHKSSITTLIVMASTLISRFLGFFRIAVISAVFGASGTADVINLTFAIPNNLRKLLAEGALSSAFIPVFSESIVNNGLENSRTREIVRTIVTFQLIILLPVSFLSIIFSRPLITYILTQFKDPEQITLSVSLFKFFINYLIFISVSAVMVGVLNSTNHFFIPAITPIIFSFSVILSILALHNILGVYSMAIGVLAGGILQILFQYPLFRKLGFSLKPLLNFKDYYFRKILKHWLPVLATSSIFTINQQVAFLFASGLKEGSTSALVNALVFFQLPFGIFSASITTVLFPRMSRQMVSNDTKGVKESISVGLRMLFSLLVPSSIFLGLFGKIIVSTALQRGLFTAENTVMASYVLSIYVSGLFSVGAFNFLQRYFYASKNFKIPFVISSFVCIIDIVLSLILKNTVLGVGGLALANSIAFTSGFILLYIIARNRLSGLLTWKFLSSVIKVILSIIPSLIISFFLIRLTDNSWQKGATMENIFYIVVIIVTWTVVTLFMYKILGNEVISFIFKGKSNAKI